MGDFLFFKLYKNWLFAWVLMLLACLLGMTVPSFGQLSLSNLRFKIIDARQPSHLLDTATVAPPILQILNAETSQPIDFQFFKLKNNYLEIDTAALQRQHPECQKVLVRFRVLPFNFEKRIQFLDTANIRRRATTVGNEQYIGYDYTPFQQRRSVVSTDGLKSQGAYTRGLSFGNAQNLVFNSNLNLQLEGNISPELELRAAISDNSIPLQPDGTTRQLQEFDRIFIQLKRKNASLDAGDFDLTSGQQPGYFMRYFKRVQGVAGQQIFQINKNDSLAVRVAAAVSRGKFNRQLIAGQEGNQGAYRLQGAENEQFIIVLAGTERVFLDGQLLRRGLQDDYIIDYNLGEITFMPRQLITKDRRIIVEFEYAVQNFLRSTTTANAQWRHGRHRFAVHAYSEQDSRNAGPAQDLRPAERLQLATVGDQLKNARTSGIDTLDAFDPARVLYEWKDTVACGQLLKVLRQASTSAARLAVRFLEVGQGQGNYILAVSAANGRVFRWVAPDPATCQPRGNFEPVVRLIAPEQRQLFAFSADFRALKHTSVQTDVAASRRDLNRFSTFDDGDNNGIGIATQLRHRFFPDKKSWEAHWLGKYEFISNNFQWLNPYRAPEFVRDWNVDFGQSNAAAEHLASSSILLKINNLGKFQYDFGNFSRSNFFEGWRHGGVVDVQWKGFQLFADANFLTSKSLTERTSFARPKLDFSKTFLKKISNNKTNINPTAPSATPILKLGMYFEREKNERRALANETLSGTSFWFDVLKFYFQVPENQRNIGLAGSVLQRIDWAAAGQLFSASTRAREANMQGSWQQNSDSRSQSLTLQMTVRDLEILAPELVPLDPQRTFLGRLDHSMNLFSNAVSMTTGYEIGSGQSPKTEFQYLAVNPGTGQYAWIDRNRDSILQVDEMEIAVFQDQANYVRVAVTTPQFIKTQNTNFNYNLRLEPRLLWRSNKIWQRWAGKISEQSQIQIARRLRAGVVMWNPLQLNIADSALVTVSGSARHSLFFNRSHPKWDMSLTFSQLQQRLALTTGFESRKNKDWTWHTRWQLAQHFSFESDVFAGKKSSDHDFFDNRRFEISNIWWQPKLTWLPHPTFRLSFQCQILEAKNAPELGGESAQQTRWTSEINWSPASSPHPNTGFRAATSLRVRGTFANIRFDGQANSAVGYAMLDGLQNGRNFLWTLQLNRQISRDIQISIGYDGRRTALRTVHTAQAQVRANF